MFPDSMFQLKNTVLIIAGGTGGHISPGIALAEAFLAEKQSVAFLTLTRNKEHPDFAKASFPVFFYDAPALSKSPVALLLFPYRFLRASLRAIGIFRSEKVSAVVGMGGFPTLPGVVAAYFFGLPFYLCEQNAVYGRVTRWMGKRARAVFATFPSADPDGASAKTMNILQTGNPIRKNILSAARKVKRSAKSEKAKGPFRVLVLGGSQGALQLNRMVAGALDQLDGVQWVLQCGVSHLESMARELGDTYRDRLHLLGYHKNIHELYGEADLLLCRSGAGVLTEAACFGLPLVLVPYPYAMDNHQLENARHFERAGAARVLDTRETDPGPLTEMIRELKANPGMLRSMGEASRSLAAPDAAKSIVEKIRADLKQIGRKMD